jgi:hypothetical protein
MRFVTFDDESLGPKGEQVHSGSVARQPNLPHYFGGRDFTPKDEKPQHVESCRRDGEGPVRTVQCGFVAPANE